MSINAFVFNAQLRGCETDLVRCIGRRRQPTLLRCVRAHGHPRQAARLDACRQLPEREQADVPADLDGVALERDGEHRGLERETRKRWAVGCERVDHLRRGKERGGLAFRAVGVQDGREEIK